MNNNFCKSTLVATGYGQTLGANATATFMTSVKTTGTSITMGNNNASINLNKAGLYRVSVSATGAVGAEATTMSLQLNRNGVALTSGIASALLDTTTAKASISFDTIVEVNKSCSSTLKAIPLTVTNTGAEAIYDFIIITIEKIA